MHRRLLVRRLVMFGQFAIDIQTQPFRDTGDPHGGFHSMRQINNPLTERNPANLRKLARPHVELYGSTESSHSGDPQAERLQGRGPYITFCNKDPQHTRRATYRAHATKNTTWSQKGDGWSRWRSSTRSFLATAVAHAHIYL